MALPSNTLDIYAASIEVRTLLTACNLPFDARCLAPQDTRRNVLSAASAAQVRQPIRPPRKYAAAYLAQLAALAASLQN